LFFSLDIEFTNYTRLGTGFLGNRFERRSVTHPENSVKLTYEVSEKPKAEKQLSGHAGKF